MSGYMSIAEPRVAARHMNKHKEGNILMHAACLPLLLCFIGSLVPTACKHLLGEAIPSVT